MEATMKANHPWVAEFMARRRRMADGIATDDDLGVDRLRSFDLMAIADVRLLLDEEDDENE
jgi:hypothetical protein